VSSPETFLLTQYPQKPTFALISPLKILLDTYSQKPLFSPPKISLDKLLLKPSLLPPKISLDTPSQYPLKKSYEIFKKLLDLRKLLLYNMGTLQVIGLRHNAKPKEQQLCASQPHHCSAQPR
jgi:hypothetical protein